MIFVRKLVIYCESPKRNPFREATWAVGGLLIRLGMGGRKLMGGGRRITTIITITAGRMMGSMVV
jgi:hypothetical protein